MHLEVAGRKRLILLDSGASRSLCRKDVWVEFARSRHRPQLLCKKEELRSLMGHEIHALGRAFMDMGGNSFPVHVVEEKYHDILLADDALTLLGVEILYRTNIVNIGGRSYTAKGVHDRDGRLAAMEVTPERWEQKYPSVFWKTWNTG